MYNLWTPKPLFINDKNIMDVAMKDTLLYNSRWPLIKHINMCRVYLKIFFVSDMTDDGKKVHLSYLEGTRRCNNHPIEFPEMQKPTKTQWELWKGFIFCNFLSPGTTINLTLGRERLVQIVPTIPESETEIYGG